MTREEFLAAVLGLAALPLEGCARSTVVGPNENGVAGSDDFEVKKSEAEWRALLTPLAYTVLFQEGTETPGTSPLNDEYRAGTFLCAACFVPLFDARAKYDSGTGWPSFWDPIPSRLALKRDLPHTLGETIIETGKIVRTLPSIVAVYWTVPLFAVAGLLWAAGLAGRKRMALFCGFAAAAFLVLVVTRSTDGMFESRYLLPMLPLLALLAGAGAERLLGAASARARLLLALVAIGAAGPALQFMWFTWVAPQQLPLGAFPDRWEYITGWPSGFALRAAAAGLAARNAPLTVIAVDQGSWERMQAHLPYGSQVKAVVWQPKDWRAGSGPPGMQPDDLLLLDHPRDDAVPQQLGVRLSAVETYYRPQRESWVTLYLVQSAP